MPSEMRMMRGACATLSGDLVPKCACRWRISCRERVQGSGFRVQGSGFRVQGSGFRVQGSGFRVQGSGFRVRRRRRPRSLDAWVRHVQEQGGGCTQGLSVDAATTSPCSAATHCSRALPFYRGSKAFGWKRVSSF